MARVFLSYSRHDLSIASKLAADLEHIGHDVWWDHHLQGGSRFASEIEAALERADAIVVLWSKHSLQSAWVQDEASEGRDSGRLVPVTLRGCKPPLGFRQFHSIDYADGSGKIAVDAAIRAIATGEKQPAHRVAAVPKRPLPLRTVVTVALALAAFLSGLFVWQGDRGIGPAHLTISQFQALSPNVPTAAAAALGEEMLDALGTDSRIVASLADNREEPAEGFVASGSLRTSGEMLRFTVHLKDGATGQQLWTSSFERPLEKSDVAPRQVAIAASMVIRCGLTGRAQHRGALSEAALAAYLNYCAEYWAETGGREMSATRGLDFARQAVALEPEFARGWSAVARMASWAIRGAGAEASRALRLEAESAARKSLSLDPLNSQGYEVLAHLQPRNSLARERLHAKSISVRPGDCGCEHVGYGGFLAAVGRPTDALAQFERARDMVPTSVSVNSSLAEGLYALGRDEEAGKLVGPILEIWPADRQMHEMIVRTAFWTGRIEPALESLANLETPFNNAERKAYANALKALRLGGDARKSAAQQLAELSIDSETRRPLLITALAALGANSEAVALARQLFGTSGSPDQFVLFEPALVAARRIPEFAALADRLGLIRYWKESGRPPAFCSVDDPPPICAGLR